VEQVALLDDAVPGGQHALAEPVDPGDPRTGLLLERADGGADPLLGHHHSRDTFAGLSQASWQLASEAKADKTAILEETFAAAQLAWQTSAASALAKMTARLGASDTALGQRIRRVQDLADRVLALHDEDQKLLTGWSAVQKADPAYARALEEFRAASIARNRDQAPTVKRQTELVRRLTALMEQCPPAQRKAGCEDADRERSAISAELNELNKAAAKGTGETLAIHARMEAAEKALPGYAPFTQRRGELRSAIDRAEQDIREARVAVTGSFPDYELTSIKLNLQGLARDARTGTLSTPSAEAVAICMLEIDRLDGVVSGVLTLAQTSPAQLGPCSVHRVATDAVRVVSAQAATQGVTVATSLGAERDVVIADAPRLHGAMLNLLLNALAAMPDGGRLVVTTEQSSDTRPVRLRLRVADTGNGVPDAERERIFRPFHTTRPNGTGLGLPIARRTIEALGGRLTLADRTRDDRGAEFVIELPLADGAVTATPAEEVTA
jgi:signal transduction histidine kinase